MPKIVIRLKKKLLVFVFTCISLLSYGQNDLDQTLSDYLKIVETLDMQKTLDYIYPKFFEVVPREQMEAALKSAFADPNIKVKLYNSKITKKGTEHTHENLSYLKVWYSFMMDMQILNQENSEKIGTSDDVTLNIFKNMYGEENVRYDSEKQAYVLLVEKPMLAIKEKSRDWKVLGLEDNMMGIMKKVLPQKVLEEMGY